MNLESGIFESDESDEPDEPDKPDKLDEPDVKNIYSILSNELEKDVPLAIATLVDTQGSTPQVTGASAIFSPDGLVAGTLGGGVLEAEAEKKAKEAIREQLSYFYESDLDASISEDESAICGGKAIIMLDAVPGNHLDVYARIKQSIENRQSGVLISLIPEEKTETTRYWIEKKQMEDPVLEKSILQFKKEINNCLKEKKYQFDARSRLFIEPINPYPHLIIAGAGHIGKAVCHLAGLLGFEITVIDDRPEFCNKGNLPEADHLITGDMGKAMHEIPKAADTYIVIVTRGHKNDGDVLRHCIDANVAYIGMIGSRRKISMMREKFLNEGWAKLSQLDRVHAPVGLEIGSKTINEIAVSICAQLILVRNQRNGIKNKKNISAIILAAGESSRIGQPKMLLPFGQKTIIETVIQTAMQSQLQNIIVVLGSEKDKIRERIRKYPVIIAENNNWQDGMLSSVHCGLRALPDDADAVMILLGDQPMVNGHITDQLADSYQHTDKGIVIASHNGKRGHPILFNKKYKNEIEKLTFQQSMHDFTREYEADILDVETGTADILRDIDTPEDYHKELKYRRSS